MARITRVSFSLNLPVKITKRRKWYLASCAVLDVHSQGETQAQAKNNLVEAVSLFFVSCLERNTLDTVLKNCGFQVAHITQPPKKRQVTAPKDYIDVPIPFWVKPSRSRECHA